MPKGLYTQCLVLLTDGRSNIDAIETALRENDFEIAKRNEAHKSWAFSGPSCLIPFRPEVRGYATVDVVSHPWPDSMGDPKTNPEIFGSWSLGQFGPFAFPGGLQRAAQQSWNWPNGGNAAANHRGFIRLRLSYVFGADKSDLVFPKDCNPIAELDFLSRAVLALAKVAGVVCYFNPNGEVLWDGAGFTETWKACRQQEKLPHLLWSNVRLFNVNPTYCLMDTVGNEQLNVRDVEAVFPKDEFEANDVGYYLRNVSHYILESGKDLKTGESIDGPNETNLSWTIRVMEEPTVAPPRTVLRLFPKRHEREILKALPGKPR